MAINAYVGVPGSGKTYEVVRSVILPAFLSGRHVVTNIEGIEQDKFYSYVDEINEKRKEKDKIDYSSLGTILKVSDEDCLKSNFFPYKGANEETIAKNGDLICIDEIWRIFDEKDKIHPNHRSFIAEHRHFVNEKGQTSDLVVINQSVANIPRFIKDRIECTFKMSKLISLGLNDRYRIDVYSGVKLFKTTLIQSIQSKYDPKIFNLYKSYDGQGKEHKIDNRVNIFKGSFLIKMFVFLILLILSILYFYFKFSGVEEEKPIENSDKSSISEPVKPVSEPVKPVSEPVKKSDDFNFNPNKAIQNIFNEKSFENNSSDIELSTDKGLSQKWRIVGFLKKEGINYVVLTDDKMFRYEYLSNFSNEGRLLTGYIDGYRVTFYSGQTLKKEKDSEVKKWLEK